MSEQKVAILVASEVADVVRVGRLVSTTRYGGRVGEGCHVVNRPCAWRRANRVGDRRQAVLHHQACHGRVDVVALGTPRFFLPSAEEPAHVGDDDRTQDADVSTASPWSRSSMRVSAP